MALSEKAKNKRDKLSPFGQWMDEAAVSKGTSLQEIAQYIGQDYAVISRFSAGTKTPTYETAMQIGEMVDDVAGALSSAGFNVPAGTATSAPAAAKRDAVRRLLATGDEIIVNPDDADPEDTIRQVEAFLAALRKKRGNSQ
jgi:hypothetical protein